MPAAFVHHLEPSKDEPKATENEQIIIPYGGSAGAELHSEAGGAYNPTILFAKVPLRTFKDKSYTVDTNKFRREHPKLVPWNNTQFWSVSPDKTAVVYVQNSKVYWQPLTGKARLIGTAKLACGVRWYYGP
jgi:hypothetical protein